MYSKSKRTMERYIEAGAWVRLYELVGHRMIDAMAPVIPTKDVDQMINMMRKFGCIKAEADTQLFHDYPKISSDALRVFYGNLSRSTSPCGDLDRQVIERAKAIVKNLLIEDGENA